MKELIDLLINSREAQQEALKYLTKDQHQNPDFILFLDYYEKLRRNLEILVAFRKQHPQERRAIMEEVAAECQARDVENCGPQADEPATWLMVLSEEVGEANQAALRSTLGIPIPFSFRKNMCEVPENSGPFWRDRYRSEMIQVAAVAIAAIENYDVMEGFADDSDESEEEAHPGTDCSYYLPLDKTSKP